MTVTILVEDTLPPFVYESTQRYDPDVRPVLLTSGCMENCLGWDDRYNPWTPETWTKAFDEMGLGYSMEQARDGLPMVPYPLTEEELAWFDEDGDNFADQSHAYWTYPTATIYRGRKWLAPYVEYNANWNGEDELRDPDDIRRWFRAQNAMAAKHIKAIQDAFATLPFDTVIYICEKGGNLDQPLGGSNGEDEYFGYRLLLDLDAAVAHFGTAEAYHDWMRLHLQVHIIEELPV